MGKKKESANVRPVSLTLVSGKIMEKIVLGVTGKHLKDNVVIDHSHNGFIRGRSCLTNFISFCNKVTHIVDQEDPVDMISVHFSKAFDTLSFHTEI